MTTSTTTSTPRVRAWREANPERARVLGRAADREYKARKRVLREVIEYVAATSPDQEGDRT